MIYREEIAKTERFKAEYRDGIMHVLKKRQAEFKVLRDEHCRNLIENQEKFRLELVSMLGWPLTEYDGSVIPPVESELLSKEDGYEIHRMSFEVLSGLKMRGLFFKAEGKKPLVICQHGGLGTPELISGVYGETANYNDMAERVIKQGVHVFAPQLLLWNNEAYGVEFDRKSVDASLKRVGSSVTAVEVYGIRKILDYFEKRDYVKNFGMAGLSYGGFYTLFTAAIDIRIKSAISCSFFNDRDAVDWSDWCWQNSAEKLADAEIACLVYPRRLCVEVGNRDELFDYRLSEVEFERLKKICPDTDWVSFIVFDGTHEFHKDDEPIKILIDDLK